MLNVVCSEIKLKTNTSEINEKNIEKIINKNFNFFKNKNNRMLTRENTEILIEFLCRDNRFAYTKDDFISDEENIGYPNVYWRCVRAGSPTDVGSVHADEWFWALGHGTIPSGYTRVKTIPIIQGEQCGLTILSVPTKKTLIIHFLWAKTERKGLSLMTQRLSRECVSGCLRWKRNNIQRPVTTWRDIVKKLQTKC